MPNLRKLQKSLRYITGKTTAVDKIAFLINENYMFDHYENIMENLSPQKFDLILVDTFKNVEHNNILDKLLAKGWTVKFLQDVIYNYKYKILISHVYFGGSTVKSGSIFSRSVNVFIKVINNLLKIININIEVRQQYLQNIIAETNVRFMYGADAGIKSFYEYGNNYCELFDHFFCHGPEDARITKRLFDKPIFVMGEPRYDHFFEKLHDQVYLCNLRKKYSIDHKKESILFITTVNDYFSTIETYAERIKNLSLNYNVIVRPHPLEIDFKSSKFNQKVFDIVTSGDLIFCGDLYQDMTELYLLADYVFCDYGGSIFSAIYMNKRIILLNHEAVKKDEVVTNSTAMEVRKYLPSIDQEETDFLNYLNTDWSRYDNNLKKARAFYFGKINADASKRAARYLSNMLGE